MVFTAIVFVVWAFASVAMRECGRWWKSDDRTEIVVMHWSGVQEEDKIVEDALREFERDNPTLRVVRINPGDSASFYTKVQTMMASGDAPDVFYVGSERIPAFVSLGLLAPLDSFLQDDLQTNRSTRLDLDAFYPATVRAFQYDGTRTGDGPLYGIPKDFTTVGFYWNKDLFARAGLAPPSANWTWDEFIADARAIGKIPGCTGAEFVTWPAMIRAYLMSDGLDVKGASFDELTTSTEKVVASLERLRAWRHDESNTLTSGKSKIASGSSVFLGGKVGLAGPFGRWVVPSYRKISPSSAGGFDWDFAPLPSGSVQSNIVLTVSWSLSSQCKHPAEAWSLIRFLTGEKNQRAFARLGLAIPSNRAAAESDSFNDPNQQPANDAGFLAAADHAQVVDWPTNPQFEALLGSRLDQGLKTGDLPLSQAIENFERDWGAESRSPLQRGAMTPMPWTVLAWIAVSVVAVCIAIFLIILRRGNLRRNERLEERSGYLLVSPWMIGFALFMAFPIAMSLALAFARWKGVSPLSSAEFVGLGNFEQLVRFDQRFRTSLAVTAYYAILAVPAGQVLALLAALLMNARLRGIHLFRAAWYLPSVLAGVGVSVLWRWIFDADGGLMNAALQPLLTPLGLTAPEWFGVDAAIWGAPAFALMSLWFVGGTMIVFLAGLQQIPVELYEAASIDGSGRLRQFWSITLPMLSPIILFNAIMAIIASFQVFTQAFVMTGGEPGDLTRFYVLYLYNQGFEFYEMGYASAMAWILLLIVLTLTVIILRTSNRWVHTDGAKA